MSEERAALHGRIESLIDALADGTRDDAARDALLEDLARYQRRHVEPYRRLCEARGVGPDAPLDELPALPTDVYRVARVSSLPARADLRTFRSSGTTLQARSVHPFADLSLYDRAARAAATHFLFPDIGEIPLLMFAPSEREQPDSSLSYMLARFGEWFGPATYVFHDNTLDLELLDETVERAAGPIALLGTSFAFVHLLDALGARRYRLHPGSRIMHTGGTKGRSREVAPDALRAALSEQFGVPDPWIIAEYGMTELSSQLYETPLREVALGRHPTARRYAAPGWVRATPVDPETLRPTDGVGLLRVDDAANLDSVACVQTSDLGRAEAGGVQVLGRAQGATARGCSLAADEALGRRP